MQPGEGLPRAGIQRQTGGGGGGPDEVDVAERVVGVIRIEEDTQLGSEQVGLDAVGCFEGEGRIRRRQPTFVGSGRAGRRFGCAYLMGAGQGLEEAHVEGGGSHSDDAVGLLNAYVSAGSCRVVNGRGCVRECNWRGAWPGRRQGHPAFRVECVGWHTKSGLGRDQATDIAGVPVALPAGGGEGRRAVRRGFRPQLGQAPRRNWFGAGRQYRGDRRERQQAAARNPPRHQRHWSAPGSCLPSDSSFTPFPERPTDPSVCVQPLPRSTIVA